ncbi:MAG: PaaI family thioesterase [Thermoanaerobaculum sp.]|nr:PaaI family thioesterase [Thermoanaerobaculum sp.]
MKLLLPQQPLCPVCGDPGENPASLAVRFTLDTETGVVWARVTLRERHLGYAGRVHGGLIAMLLDEAMAWACAARARTFCTTGELKVRLKKPVPPHQELELRAWVADTRGPYLRGLGELTPPAGHLLATATGTFAAMPRQQSLALRRFLRWRTGELDVLTGRVVEVLGTPPESEDAGP